MKPEKKNNRSAGRDSTSRREREPNSERRSDGDDPDLVDEEVMESLEQDQNLDYGTRRLQDELNDLTAERPRDSAGEVNADRHGTQSDGEESVGGSVPTPDQDRVDDIGEAVGLTYSDTEPLHTADKLDKRDKNRWELDPVSSPDYEERVKMEFREPEKDDNTE